MLDDFSSGESTYVLGVQAEAAVEPISEVSIHLGTPPLPYGTNIKSILDRFREDGLLCRLITYIAQATWYKIPGAAEILDDSLLKELVSAKFMKPGDSPFRPFFTKDANHYCTICHNSKIPRRSLERALGHARGHFEHTIDGKFTNKNTKKDVESRKKKNGGRYECSIWYE